MATAKLADSPTIRRLGQGAEARDDPGPSADTLRHLADGAKHVGVVLRLEEPDTGETAGADAGGDTRAWVVWLLQLPGDEGRYMVMIVSTLTEMSGLEEVEVTDELADMALEFAREEFGGTEFAVQPGPGGLRLVSLAAGRPGLCVRCRTAEPATAVGYLLVAPEGPVCAGCLNLGEQITWGEAALEALRRAGAHAEQIAAVEREVAALRAQVDAGPA
jgi:hypothetical protein